MVAMDMKNNLFFTDLVCGIIIGVGMVAPGLSGGVFAVAFGLYPRIIEGIHQIRQHPIKVFCNLFWIGIGGVIGSVITLLIILSLIEYFPMPFTVLFVGFIIGSFKDIKSKIMNDLHTGWKIALFILFFTLILCIPLMPKINDTMMSLNTISIFILFFIGFILAGTLIIPGISGSMIMMALGVYTYLLTTGQKFLSGLVSLNISTVLFTALPLIIIGCGFVVGLILFAKGIKYLLDHYQSVLYVCILGLLVASPFSIVWEASVEYTAFFDYMGYTIPASLCLFVLGFLLARWIESNRPS